METLHNTHIIQKMSNTRARVRLALTLVGIVAAIICLFTLLYEVRSPSNVATVSQLIGASKIVRADFSVEITNVSVVSAIWPFR
jgi:hypothetical protein